ncbi:hypothetical protein PoB_005961300 [Plakobranchus ocellatus]|uniref:IgGFc-binding protein N-terminal domain-containing protein n=1 Tax=Plakobranchus ocellatus TaxID=259542 RepID=A0AAV4CMF8_9GAST|nr:hypothetical protein PoB_005961300 [Plakobranchus ocellatus]
MVLAWLSWLDLCRLFAAFTVIVAGATGQNYRKFVLFYTYRNIKVSSCALQLHITTEEPGETLVDVRTPRLRSEEGGFRKSTIVTQRNSVLLCTPHRQRRFKAGRSNDAIVLEASKEVFVLVVMHLLGGERNMHPLYPLDVMDTVYYFRGSTYSLLVLVATQPNTLVDISDCVHSHRDLPYYNTSKPQYEAIVLPHDQKKHLQLKGHVLPGNHWGKIFFIPTLMNPHAKNESVELVFDRVVAYKGFDISIPLGRIVYRWHRTDNYAHSTLSQHVLQQTPWLLVNSSSLAALAFHYLTSNGGNSSLGITNIPPADIWRSKYVWSLNVQKSWMAYLHVFFLSKELDKVTLTQPDGSVVKIPQVKRFGPTQAGRVQLSASGTFVLAYKNNSNAKPFAAFVETYDKQGQTTIVTELGTSLAKYCRGRGGTPGRPSSFKCRKAPAKVSPAAPEFLALGLTHLNTHTCYLPTNGNIFILNPCTCPQLDTSPQPLLLLAYNWTHLHSSSSYWPKTGHVSTAPPVTGPKLDMYPQPFLLLAQNWTRIHSPSCYWPKTEHVSTAPPVTGPKLDTYPQPLLLLAQNWTRIYSPSCY